MAPLIPARAKEEENAPRSRSQSRSRRRPTLSVVESLGPDAIARGESPKSEREESMDEEETKEALR